MYTAALSRQLLEWKYTSPLVLARVLHFSCPRVTYRLLKFLCDTNIRAIESFLLCGPAARDPLRVTATLAQPVDSIRQYWVYLHV